VLVRLIPSFRVNGLLSTLTPVSYFCFNSTTVLPSLFVLLGFIIFTVSAPKRDLVPVQLDLNDYNPTVKASPRNPIPFNEPGNPYACQPGICAYQKPVVVIPETKELYYYCGSQAWLINNCTVSESASIVGRINEAGASAEGIEVSGIFEVSLPALAKLTLSRDPLRLHFPNLAVFCQPGAHDEIVRSLSVRCFVFHARYWKPATIWGALQHQRNQHM
jgi:hypothetical protein